MDLRMMGKIAWLLAAALTLGQASGAAAQLLDREPRTAIMTAFAPEKAAMMALLKDKKIYRLQGGEIVTGTLEGRPVLLAESGMSMVNAAMTAQSLLDHFKIERIVFSGIAGGIDPALHVGDVVVPEEWAQPMESVMMRERPDGPNPPGWMEDELTDLSPFGAMKSKKVDIAGVFHQSFKSDPALLATARKVASSLALKSCASDRRCLDQPPQVLVGGMGVSTQSFIDNARLRD